MKTVDQLDQALTLIRAHQATAQRNAAALDAELTRMPTEGYTPDHKEQKAKEIRAKYVPLIGDALNEVKKLNDQIRPSTPLWESTTFVLSTRPVSPSLNNQPHAPAADGQAESVARLAKMTELSKMDSSLLHLHADAAKATGAYGTLHLINQENSTRSKEPGHKPVDMSGIVLPDQQQALSMLKEGQATQLELEHTWRTADNGRPINPAERITLARMKSEVNNVA